MLGFLSVIMARVFKSVAATDQTGPADQGSMRRLTKKKSGKLAKDAPPPVILVQK